MALEKIDSTNPLQPGDPFKRQNFNKFSLGMMFLIVVLGVLLVVLFLLYFRKHSATHARSSQSLVVWPGAVPARS